MSVNNTPGEEQNIITLPYKGGPGGDPFDDFDPTRKVITHIRVRAAKYIDAIQVFYHDDTRPTDIHGGSGGDVYDFYLDKGEKIIQVDGRAARYMDGIRFHTNTGRSSPAYGGPGGDAFNWQAPEGYHLRYFIGRSASYVDGLQPAFQSE